MTRAAACLLQGKSYQVHFLRYLLESKKKSFLFLVGIAGEMREAGSSFRGGERSKSCSTGGEGEAGIINQAEERETRTHSFEVTIAFFYGK